MILTRVRAALRGRRDQADLRGIGRRERAGSAAHQAAVLFVAAGTIGLVSDLIHVAIGRWNPIAVLIDSTTLSIGLLAMRLPWRRWSDRAPLVLPVLAMVNIATTHIAGVLPEATFGVWYVLVFVWIGMWQPPRTSYAMAPLAVVAYLVPFAFNGSDTPDAAATVIISIPVAVLVGETIARRAEATRRAEAGHAAAVEALALASVTDDLTGLGNRRGANALLDALGDGDALAVLDLDHFKQVNDTYGHAHGDEVLHELGAFLRAAVRDGDSVARYGGEEFVVVLRRLGPGAFEVVERILADWRATAPLATLSAGVAVKQPGQSWRTTFALADAALYEAKAAGRDRAVLHRDTATSTTPADGRGNA